jgi:hypothetical protein
MVRTYSSSQRYCNAYPPTVRLDNIYSHNLTTTAAVTTGTNTNTNTNTPSVTTGAVTAITVTL